MKRVFACIGLALLLCSTGNAWGAVYTITDLGNLGGTTGQIITVNGINSSGEVVGAGTISGGATHGFIYSGGVMRDIGTLGGTTAYAYDINDSGVVVGYSMLSSGSQRPISYTISGGMKNLSTLPGGPASGVATGINNGGQIVGNSSGQAFLYSGGATQSLGTLGGATSSAMGINSSGLIVGYSQMIGNSTTHAFSYTTAGGFNDLGTLSGKSNSYGYGVNDSGQIVGYSQNAPTDQHAFLYSGGSMQDLGTFGGNVSVAYDINNSGQIVGTASKSGVGNRAFLYSGTTKLDLNDLIASGSGWTLTHAQAISEAGQIAGYGTIGGQTHAFLLTPVPEPSTLAIWSILGGIGAAVAWRRKRKA